MDVRQQGKEEAAMIKKEAERIAKNSREIRECRRSRGKIVKRIKKSYDSGKSRKNIGKKAKELLDDYDSFISKREKEFHSDLNTVIHRKYHSHYGLNIAIISVMAILLLYSIGTGITGFAVFTAQNTSIERVFDFGSFFLNFY